MKKIAFLLVNYNNKIDNLNIIDKLKYSEIDYYILDNSVDCDILEFNKKFKLSLNLYYINMNGNVGVAKAYNKGIGEIKNKYKYIGLLDDDTKVTDEYFELVLNNIDKNYKVIVPNMVNNKKKKLSPHVSKRLQAINSCSVILSSILANNLFDEELFMYYVDIGFFKSLNITKEQEYKILDTDVLHPMSFYQNCYGKNTEQAIKRILNDAAIYYDKNSLRIFFDKIYFVKEILIYNKDIRALRIFLL